MIHHYQSHSISELSNQFQLVIGQIDSKNPLQPVWVIVQNNEIKEWLSLKVAQEKGISGNFRFIFPSEFLWVLYRIIRDDIPQNLPSDLNSMQWILFELFREEPQLLSKVPLSDDDKHSDSQLFYLSAQLADVFDQYQVYRPEMTEQWLNQKLVTKSKEEQWQAFLWKRLNQYWISDELSSEIPSRAKAYKQLLSWMRDENSELWHHLPDNIFAFGLSHNSHPFLNILAHLGDKKEVHVFSRNLQTEFPKEELNQIVKNWNRTALDQQNLFSNLVEKAGSTLKKTQLDSQDPKLPNLRIHSCHSVRREVQVLKDSILHYLEDNPEAAPKDILVMVPDAAEYGPVLESYFSGKENDSEQGIPISKLYDSQRVESHTLIALLDVLGSDYKPGSVLEILNLSPVRKKFDISDDEMDIIEEWVIENHMHRGIGKTFNSKYSWKKGVNQLIAGLSMEPGELELYKGLAPYRGLYASEEMELVARFSQFLHILFKASEAIQNDKKPVKWIDFTENLTSGFLQDAFSENNLSGIYSTLSKLKEQISFSSNKTEVSFTLIRSWLKSQLESKSSSSGRFGQGITVSSYIPYRSVPFRFIAVLGMNEGVFPRKAVRPDFDLIYANPQAGDRIQKEDDTYLFLETLFAAEHHLHISYCGQDQKNDSERLPSSLVQQLIEAAPENRLRKYKHSLHAFGPTYFRPESKFSSFSQGNSQIAKNITLKHQEQSQFFDDNFVQPDIEEMNQVPINDFIQFFSDASKYMVQNYLQISDRLFHKEISDRESFDLDGLQSYQLGHFMFDKISSDFSKEQILSYAKTAALIPDKLKGDKVFEHQFSLVQELKSKIEELSSTEPETVDVELEIGGIELFGRVPGIHGKTYINSRVGRRKPASEIAHWINHLLLLKSGVPIERSLFISKEKGEISVLQLLSSEMNPQVLEDYVAWFKSKNPILQKTAFFPETSKSYAASWLKEQNHEKALNKAVETWEPSYNQSYVESNNFYNQLMWRGRSPLETSGFAENALKFWLPFLETEEASND